MNRKELAKYIDHTLLKPDAEKAQIIAVCEEAKAYHTASVCVNPCWVGTVHEALKGSDVKTCAVVGFPLGATLTSVKAFEAAQCVEQGAQEVDMVLNVGFVKGGQWDLAMKDIEAVVKAVKGKAAVKVILETCLLSQEEKIRACEIAQAACADFVKTSTGFSTGGATVEDIALMRRTVGGQMGVKASGGVRTRAQAEAMIAAGATRIGASSSRAILED